MAREYKRLSAEELKSIKQSKLLWQSGLFTAGALGIAASPIGASLSPLALALLGAIPGFSLAKTSAGIAKDWMLELERKKESQKRNGQKVLGAVPQRDCFKDAIKSAQNSKKVMIDKYLVGFDLESGEPLWVGDEELCSHACVFAKTGVGKTLFLESLMFQQMLRGRASGCTFIDAKRDSGTLAQVILMALVAGRIEDLIVIDPFDPVHSYNFVMTDQRADVKARKVLRAGLPPTSDQSSTKHYDRLAADAIARMVRALENLGLAWSIHDVAVALSSFNLSYPYLRSMLKDIGAKQALVELGHLAASYRNAKGALDSSKLTDNLRGISSELHAISGSAMGSIFCTNYSDLALTDAMLRGKIIYFMLPRLEEAESAARMVKLFREDLEVSIGEITSSRVHNLEDPHLIIVDEGSSTFGPTWANLFELARKGRFALLFGAQSTGGLTDNSLGLSEAFYERVMANVNLKVMMRVGDNRTAQDMAEWFGKVATTKTSVGAGLTTNSSTRVFGGAIDTQARSGGGESQSISISEDEEYYVSPEELKHEMSAEKGLAWYDMGNGKIVKGRSFWLAADLPDTWEGREHLVEFEKFEQDPVGLGSWVDEQVLLAEQKEIKYQNRSSDESKISHEDKSDKKTDTIQKEDDAGGVFKLDLQNNNKVRGVVRAFANPESTTKEESSPEKNEKQTKKGKTPTGRFGVRK